MRVTHSLPHRSIQSMAGFGAVGLGLDLNPSSIANDIVGFFMPAIRDQIPGLVDSAMPEITNRIPAMVDQAVPLVTAKIPDMVNQAVPLVIKQVPTIMNSVMPTIKGQIPGLINAAMPTIKSNLDSMVTQYSEQYLGPIVKYEKILLPVVVVGASLALFASAIVVWEWYQKGQAEGATEAA